MKRLFDIFFSFLGLVVLSPLFVFLSVLIKLDSKDPVFYGGERVGKNGTLFKMYKFRTMRVDADKMAGGPSCADDDPRITKLGGLLRKYKLNELPQLINVLKGDMSFVGPRPEVQSEVETYSEEEKRILTVKPGITDYASLTFHDEGEILKGAVDPHQAYREKIRPGKLKLALKYVDKQSFWVDLKILANTFLVIVKTRKQRQMSKSESLEQYRLLSKKIRRRILKIICKTNSPHIGSCFSSVEILVGLYFRTLNISPENPFDDKRDRFIMSKGHACAALFSVLTERGFISEEDFHTFATDGGVLEHHPNKDISKGIEMTSGSLGHGLSIGVGLALAARHDNNGSRVYILLGDGDMNEGSVWEAIMFAGHHKLNNLTAIIDYNKIQALGFSKDIINMEPIAGKWLSFGWAVKKINGHDFGEIVQALDSIPFSQTKPSVIIADTLKGNGVSFMENKLLWHYRTPNDAEYQMALEELQ